VRLPIALLRVGIRFMNLIPRTAREQVNDEMRKQGMDFDLGKLTPEELEALIDNLQDVTIDVQRPQDNVSVKLVAE